METHRDTCPWLRFRRGPCTYRWPHQHLLALRSFFVLKFYREGHYLKKKKIPFVVHCRHSMTSRKPLSKQKKIKNHIYFPLYSFSKAVWGKKRIKQKVMFISALDGNVCITGCFSLLLYKCLQSALHCASPSFLFCLFCCQCSVECDADIFFKLRDMFSVCTVLSFMRASDQTEKNQW